MSAPRVVVIGAGAGGLAAAADLARQGLRVTLLEAADTPGGKMRQLSVAGSGIDAGPTVFTMPWVFEGLFGDAGVNFGDAVTARRAEILARHAWTSGGALDLHADIHTSSRAVADVCGETEAQGFLQFCERSAGIHATLRDTFMNAQQPNPLELVRRVGLHKLRDLLATSPQRTLWAALGDYFRDPRLRQLFGRYATYVGSSPLQTPATLMLIAHVEQDGVWLLPGGMYSLAQAIADLGTRAGVTSHYNCPASVIECNAHGAVGAVIAGDQRFAADAVVFAGDNAALSGGLLGPAVSTAVAPVARNDRGLSAITWCVKARTRGFALHYHNVFFDSDYPDEFDHIFQRRQVRQRPTVYVCAQDRIDGTAPDGPERLLMLINAPPDGDRDDWHPTVVADMQARALAVMAACGLQLDIETNACTATTPRDFALRFPGGGGSLYGRASHGMMSSFNRPGARSRVAGLYLAGGSVHPGPGVPMATLSGRLAAAALMQDLSQQRRISQPAALKQGSHPRY